jgi:tRNA(Ile)-lysidine synthase
MKDSNRFGDLELGKCFNKVSTQTEIALAVSGGPDSMALLLLVDRWRRARLQQGQVAPEVMVFTIDHGLRPQASVECRFVVKKARELGYNAEILHWEGLPPTTRIQEKARDIRYQLLAGACHLHGIKTLMIAHHLDDQAETFLMRLARGSGVDGLAAMAEESQRYGLLLMRPLLGFEKADLLGQLCESGWNYITDPSNTDLRFERVRLRECNEELQKLGLTSAMIGLSAARLRRVKRALNEVSERFLAQNAFISDFGTARIDQLAFFDAPDEIAIRALSKILRICGGSHEVPNMARLEKLTTRLKADFATNRTLAGCRLIAKGDFWLIVRETGRITETAKPIVPGACMFWDSRYIVCADQAASKSIVAGPLVKIGDLKDTGYENALQNIPKEARSSLLAFRRKGELLAVPAIDFWKTEAKTAGLQAKYITSDDGLL